MLEFYCHPISPPSRAVQIFLRMAGIEHTAHVVNLLSGEQRAPEFLAMNPTGQVPVIKDGDYVLSECQAILAYLHASRHCADQLYPADLKQRGRVDRHMHWFHTNIREGGLLFHDTVVARMKGQTVPEVIVEERKTALRNSLAEMEGLLGSQSYMAGDNLTIADLGTYSYCVQVRAIGYDFAPYPRVIAWMDRISGLSEVREVNQVFLSEIMLHMRHQIHERNS